MNFRHLLLSSLSVLFNSASVVGETVESDCNARDPGSIPGLGRSPGEGNGNPLQYGCLENPMDGGAWRATVHGVAKSQTRLHCYTTCDPMDAARQASLSITIFRSLLKLMSIESEMPSNHLILCCPLLLLPSVLPIVRVFSNESTLPISWPKYWSFSFSIKPSNEYSEWISFRID